MTPGDVVKLVKTKDVKYADLRFTDTRGKEQHVTIPSRYVTEEFFEEGKMFDGSSIAGWKGINESDMILMPDPSTAIMDPFFADSTVNIRCDIIEPVTMKGYERDPRSLGKRAEAYLKSTGIADGALFGPENEFFIFDSARWNNDMHGCGYAIDSVQGIPPISVPKTIFKCACSAFLKLISWTAARARSRFPPGVSAGAQST